jgi:hypothetical protein
MKNPIETAVDAKLRNRNKTCVMVFVIVLATVALTGCTPRDAAMLLRPPISVLKSLPVIVPNIKSVPILRPSSVVVSPAPVVVNPEPAPREAASREPASRRGHIPPGHRPPPGKCRIWYPNRPPGHQPPPGNCKRLKRHVPRGAWLIRG